MDAPSRHDDPARPADASSVSGLRSPAAVQPPIAALRMLYVEDNRINALLFEEVIGLHAGVELRIAGDKAEALDLVRAWRPDVLVLDAHLPDASGFELLEALRAQPGLGKVPAFMCSADASPADLQRASAAGFAGYWCKPIDLATIMNDLDRICACLPPDETHR